jgi:hypothetical protein
MRHLPLIRLLPLLDRLHPIINPNQPLRREMRPQRLPALRVIILLHLCALVQSPLRHANHQTTLKHKRHTALANLARLQLDITRLLVRRRIRPMPRHDIVQRRARRLEAAARLRVVLAANEAHELGHGVAVVPGGPEGVLSDEPARREDDKVGDGGARHGRLRSEHREDGGVRVVEGYAADGVEAPEVVLVRVVQAVPGDDVKGRVALLRRVQVACKLAEHGPRRRRVLVKGGDGGLEVARVGEAVGPNGAEFGELEMPLVQLEDVAAHGAVWERDAISDAARDYADFVGAHEQAAQLGLDVEDAVLGHDEEVAVGGIKRFVGGHVFARSVNEVAHASLGGGVTVASDQVQRVDPVDCLVEVEGVPAQLVGDEVDLLVWFVFGIRVEGFGFARLEVGVSA